MSRKRALSDVVVKVRAFDMSLFRKAVGKVDVQPSMETGLPIQVP